MILRSIFVCLIALIIYSCSQPTSKTGLKIEYGPNLGLIDTFAAGSYIHITATITNDTIVPINLQMDLSGEYDYPDSCGIDKYKLFLLPEELTPDTATLYGITADGLADFLDNCMERSYTLNKTLKPGEYSVITIGTLFKSTKCAALPRAIFAQGDGHNFNRYDSRMGQDKSINPQLELGVKIDFYSGKGSAPERNILHPFGQVSYP